ncbi:MAG: membrane protein insertion efficiency factor YidD [Candidatus Rhabdochlamydia sp.]
MVFKLFLFFLPLSLFSLPGYEEPWGKDSDLSFFPRKKSSQQTASSLSPLAYGMKRVIVFHQQVISPVDGPRSHFRPSSSTYMLEAIQKYGFFKGYIMGCDRLLRENSDPWVYRTRYIHGKIWKIDPPR